VEAEATRYEIKPNFHILKYLLNPNFILNPKYLLNPKFHIKPKIPIKTRRYGLNTASIPAFTSILSCERACVIEMTGLNVAEVRELLLLTLEVCNICM
jgi:hypothetical protein